MSIQAVGWVLDNEHTTAGAERLVLLSLANHAGWRSGQWECYPSVELIASEAGIHRRETVKDALARLIERGLITRIVNAAPDSRIPANRRPNLYVLHISPGGTESAPAERLGGADTAARGGGLRALGGADTAPQTITEPSEEPPPAHVSPNDRGGRVDEALQTLASREADAAPPGSIRSPSVWRVTVIESNRKAYGSTLHSLAHEHPDWTADELADAVAPPAPDLAVVREQPICSVCLRHTRGLIECGPGRDDCPVTFSTTLDKSVGNHPASRAN